MGKNFEQEGSRGGRFVPEHKPVELLDTIEGFLDEDFPETNGEVITGEIVNVTDVDPLGHVTIDSLRRDLESTPIYAELVEAMGNPWVEVTAHEEKVNDWHTEVMREQLEMRRIIDEGLPTPAEQFRALTQA